VLNRKPLDSSDVTFRQAHYHDTGTASSLHYCCGLSSLVPPRNSSCTHWNPIPMQLDSLPCTEACYLEHHDSLRSGLVSDSRFTSSLWVPFRSHPPHSRESAAQLLCNVTFFGCAGACLTHSVTFVSKYGGCRSFRAPFTSQVGSKFSNR
jgi:hypothetical protein